MPNYRLEPGAQRLARLSGALGQKESIALSKPHVPVLDDIAEGILKLLFHFLIEIVFFYTGECVLYVVTFGRKETSVGLLRK
ncbi:MAG: hypothetical protein ACREQ7_02210 [Candidatus Binatia bacterium]